MGLADFILQNIEPILVEWEAFAASLSGGKQMESLALRDHAPEILKAIVRDLQTTQTSQAQFVKSIGQAPVVIGAPETAAQTHATLRAQIGFDVIELASEYRALRASVLRLWAASCAPREMDLSDVIRFNEAVDQALAESIEFFSEKVDQFRNLLLGMLGHDMRSPLQTIQMTSSYLAALNAGESVSTAAERLMRSGARMKALLDDLVDFNRTRLGLGIAVQRSNIDVGHLFNEEIDQLRVAHPDRTIELEVAGDAMGEWDGNRLQQVLANLVSNAVQYGSQDSPVRVVVTGIANELKFEVINTGCTIDQSALDEIFEPLKRGADRNSVSENLGLGLYIVREVVRAHAGEITVRSNQSETVFSVVLPRHH